MDTHIENSFLLFSFFLSSTITIAAVRQDSFIIVCVLTAAIIEPSATLHRMRSSLDVRWYGCYTAIGTKIVVIFKSRRADPSQISLFLFNSAVLVCQKLLFLIANYMTFQILLCGILKIWIVVFYGAWWIVHLLLWYRYVILCWALHHKVIRCPVSNDFLKCIHVNFLRLFLFLTHDCVRRRALLYVIWFFYLIRTFRGNAAWNKSLDRWLMILGSTDARYFRYPWHTKYSWSLFKILCENFSSLGVLVIIYCGWVPYWTTRWLYYILFILLLFLISLLLLPGRSISREWRCWANVIDWALFISLERQLFIKICAIHFLSCFLQLVLVLLILCRHGRCGCRQPLSFLPFNRLLLVCFLLNCGGALANFGYFPH